MTSALCAWAMVYIRRREGKILLDSAQSDEDAVEDGKEVIANVEMELHEVLLWTNYDPSFSPTNLTGMSSLRGRVL